MSDVQSQPPGPVLASEPGQGSETLVTECELPAAPQTVWRALTEPRLLAAWLLPNDIRPEPGATFTLQPSPGAPEERIECQVLDAEAPRLLRYTWRTVGSPVERGAELNTTVTFELFPTSSGGTRLKVSHAGFPAALMQPVALRARHSGASSGECTLRWAA